MGDLDLPSWSLQYLNLHGQVQLQPGAGDLAIIIDFNQSLELLTLPVESRLSLTDICCQVSPLNNLRFGLRFRTDKAWSPYFISWRPCHRIPLGFGLMQNLDLKCSPTRIDIEPDHYNIPLFWQSLQRSINCSRCNWIESINSCLWGLVEIWRTSSSNKAWSPSWRPNFHSVLLWIILDMDFAIESIPSQICHWVLIEFDCLEQNLESWLFAIIEFANLTDKWLYNNNNNFNIYW